MSLELAGTIVSGVSAMSALIQAWVAARQLEKPLSPQDVDATIQKAEANAAQRTDVAEQLDDVIDDDILQTIGDNIDDAKERLKKSLKDRANDQAAKDHAVDIANDVICSELSRIKRLNGGRLPGRQYQRYWISHGCKD